MKIKFRKSAPNYSYFAGDVTDSLSDKQCAQLINEGFAIAVPETEGNENELPDELPAREILFANGLETIDDIKKAVETLTDFDGIGNKTAENIKAYLKSSEEEATE